MHIKSSQIPTLSSQAGTCLCSQKQLNKTTRERKMGDNDYRYQFAGEGKVTLVVKNLKPGNRPSQGVYITMLKRGRPKNNFDQVHGNSVPSRS